MLGQRTQIKYKVVWHLRAYVVMLTINVSFHKHASNQIYEFLHGTDSSYMLRPICGFLSILNNEVLQRRSAFSNQLYQRK